MDVKVASTVTLRPVCKQRQKAFCACQCLCNILDTIWVTSCSSPALALPSLVCSWCRRWRVALNSLLARYCSWMQKRLGAEVQLSLGTWLRQHHRVFICSVQCAVAHCFCPATSLLHFCRAPLRWGLWREFGNVRYNPSKSKWKHCSIHCFPIQERAVLFVRFPVW